MTPPTQAGKFKPRKPVKKSSSAAAAAASSIQPGTSVAAPGAAGAAAAGGSAATGGGRASAARGGGRGARGRGRGGGARGGGARGGGRGGGRGRLQVQQGQAYFTAAPPSLATAASSAARFGSSNKTAAAVARRLQQQDGAGGGRGTGVGGRIGPGGSLLVKKENDLSQQEEVVGMLDEAIGSNLAPDKVKSRLLSDSSGGGGGGGGGASSGPLELSSAAEKEASRRTEGTDAFTYDSDSSMQDADEEQQQQQLGPQQRELEPMTLPFSPIPAPIGIGGTHETRHSNFYRNETTAGAASDGDTKTASATTIITEDPILPSPFVDMTTNDIKYEKDSWFLVQLPTRLPPLQSATSPNDATNNVGFGDDDLGAPESSLVGSSTMSVTTTTPIAEVATAPVIVDSFDNALVTAKPGRLGRFVVHRSGKTVLVLETPDGGEIRMNATEGLTCAFRQQAVIINQDRSEFVPLGEVKKTIVVTPDLEGAFPS